MAVPFYAIFIGFSPVFPYNEHRKKEVEEFYMSAIYSAVGQIVNGEYGKTVMPLG